MTPPAVEANASASHLIEPPLVPDGTFVRVRPDDHPMPSACEFTVNSGTITARPRSSALRQDRGRIDADGGEYLVMLDNFECLGVPMRRVGWRKVST